MDPASYPLMLWSQNKTVAVEAAVEGLKRSLVSIQQDDTGLRRAVEAAEALLEDVKSDHVWKGLSQPLQKCRQAQDIVLRLRVAVIDEFAQGQGSKQSLRAAEQMAVKFALPVNPLLQTARQRLRLLGQVDAMATHALQSFELAAANFQVGAAHKLALERVITFAENPDHQLAAQGWKAEQTAIITRIRELLAHIEQEEAFVTKLNSCINSGGWLNKDAKHVGDYSSYQPTVDMDTKTLESTLKASQDFKLITPHGHITLLHAKKISEIRHKLKAALEMVLPDGKAPNRGARPIAPSHNEIELAKTRLKKEETVWKNVENLLSVDLVASEYSTFPAVSLCTFVQQSEEINAARRECKFQSQVRALSYKLHHATDQEDLQKYLLEAMHVGMGPKDFPVVSRAQEMLHQILRQADKSMFSW